MGGIRANRIEKQAREGALAGSNGPMHCAPRLPLVFTLRARPTGRRLAWSGGGEKCRNVRPLVLFALIAPVACTASPRTPDAVATLLPTLAPTRVLPAMASPEPPAITVPPLVPPGTLPLPNVAVPTVPLPSAVPIPTVAPVLTLGPLRIAPPRPLSTIPAVIRPAAPTPTPGLLPLPTSLPIPPPIIGR